MIMLEGNTSVGALGAVLICLMVANCTSENILKLNASHLSPLSSYFSAP